ncbi:MAG: type I restriction enzyme HsdR N-terminal domain-containing protein [Candidatus Bostrichicola ureolyticus]|nr:MAG: type I restriction enzyme HsdR N-terminal domain-containing protein [Candidatus Bostrichicola ureolyticus]
MQNNKKFIYCIIRKKKYLLTQEELVRQHVIKFLVLEKGYSLSGIAVEVPILVNNIRRRIDIVVYKCAIPYIIIECKSPKNIIPSQNDFNQILIYNLVIKSHYLMITNGIQHVFFIKKNKKFIFLKKIPFFKS